MGTLAQARRAKFHEQLQLTIAGRCQLTFEPTKEYPGSEEKISVLTDRCALARKRHQDIDLFCVGDSRLSLHQGWRGNSEPNGRTPIENRRLVHEDAARAKAHAEQLKEDRLYVLEEIKRLLATEAYPCPGQAS